MSSDFCSTLVPKYQAWRQALARLESAKDRYQESGGLEDQKDFKQSLGELKLAKRDYLKAAYVKVEYGKFEIVGIEAMVLQKINEVLSEGGDEKGMSIDVNSDGRITTFRVFDNQSVKIEEAIDLIFGFKELLELQYEMCSNLSRLPKLPSSLKALGCSNNSGLQVLPELPNSLKTLSFYGNKFISLPRLPSSLLFLGCSKSPNLEALPELPKSMWGFFCGDCPKLKIIPELPSSLLEFDCSGCTSLTDLPELPDTLYFIDITGTLAAEDPKVIERLDGFKKRHPQAEVVY